MCGWLARQSKRCHCTSSLSLNVDSLLEVGREGGGRTLFTESSAGWPPRAVYILCVFVPNRLGRVADEPRLTPVPRWTIGGAVAANQRARRSEFVKFTAGDGRGIRPKWAPECGGPGRGPVGIQNQHPPATAAPRARSHAAPALGPHSFPRPFLPSPFIREDFLFTEHTMCSSPYCWCFPFPELMNKFSLFDVYLYFICVYCNDWLHCLCRV